MLQNGDTTKQGNEEKHGIEESQTITKYIQWKHSETNMIKTHHQVTAALILLVSSGNTLALFILIDYLAGLMVNWFEPHSSVR